MRDPKVLVSAPFKGRHIRAVFTDLDGTLTSTEGKLDAQTYETLWRLSEAGFFLAIVTGGPAGWADCMLKLWPIDAIVFENGAGFLTQEKSKHRMVTLAGNDRETQRATLAQIFSEIQSKIPEAKVSSDQSFRLFDFAIDVLKEPPHLSEEQIEAILKILSKKNGITASRSNIHINFWCGTHNKVTACNELLNHFGPRRGISKETTVFIGDAPNDEPLFEHFDWTVGVANLVEFLGGLKHHPRFLTREKGSKGFQELAEILLSAGM